MVTVGIDEVGRGCWAGPLVAGAVVFDRPMRKMRDSKKLTKLQREKLALNIYHKALCWGVGWVSPREVDRLGLTGATMLAMQRALGQITTDYDEIIIDGNINYLPEEPKAHAVVKADDTVPVVSAASIIAKVARDDFMAKAAEDYPDYGFDKHVGYGTSLHLDRLKLHGACDLHRQSFKPIAALIQ